jgi:NAD-dependent SIR2 family protein deacetylase
VTSRFLKKKNHGTGNVNYLTDFFLTLSSFGKPTNKIIRLFTTNIDLCVEAAFVQLSQRSRSDRRPDFVFIDGFECSILPTFNMGCYRQELKSCVDKCAVYYWKLHGSIDWTYSQAIGENQLKDSELDYSDQSIIIRRIDKDLLDSLMMCGALSSMESNGNKRIVIFPTPAKYSQTYTFPYMDMFEAFRRTLEEIELLICIGTSFPDQHIRSAIRSFVERDNTLLFVVDPYIKKDYLKTIFGISSSIQPVINMEFLNFVQDFKALDVGIDLTNIMEATQ